MALNKKDITLLCKVVDNYGDIGFVYRLARRLSQLDSSLKLRIVISNLKSFAAMAPQVNPELKVQDYSFSHEVTWKILDWNAEKECTEEYRKNPPQVILECFQCGRPDWLENLLFDKSRNPEDIVQVVNLEYLTAEDWADDFHLLKSGTRSASVKKINFMPGFTAKTGGLVLDEPFMTYLKDRKSAEKAFKASIPSLKEDFFTGDCYNTAVFSYSRCFTAVVKALNQLQSRLKTVSPENKLNVFLTSGLAREPFLKAYEENQGNFNIVLLPYVPQNAWDALLTLNSFNFIRGEDSFARACLSKVPFVWHVYVQEEEFQLVKLQAFLNRLKPFMEKELFEIYSQYSFLYNRNYDCKMGQEAEEAWNSVFSGLSEPDPEEEMEKLLSRLLENSEKLKSSFEAFSDYLVSNGDLAQNLLNWLKTI